MTPKRNALTALGGAALLLAGTLSAGAVSSFSAARTTLDQSLFQSSLVIKVMASPIEIQNKLRQMGYDRIEFTDLEYPGYYAQACLNNNLMRVKLNNGGTINKVSRIGACQSTADMIKAERDLQEMEIDGFRNILNAKGYEGIQVTDTVPPIYKAWACQGSKQHEISSYRSGFINKVSAIGTCKPQGPAIAMAKIKAEKKLQEIEIDGFRNILIAKGYEGIQVTDTVPPIYKAWACQGSKQHEISSYRSGFINKVSAIGTCKPQGPAIAMAKIKAKKKLQEMEIDGFRNILKAKGYEGIQVTDTVPPIYKAWACQGSKQHEISSYRSGFIDKVSAIGTCKPEGPAIAMAKIKAEKKLINMELGGFQNILKAKGYEDIQVTDVVPPVYKAWACKAGRQHEISSFRSGFINKINAIGTCSDIRSGYQFAANSSSDGMLSNRNNCEYRFQSLLSDKPVMFKPGSRKLTGESRDFLDRVASISKKCPDAQLQVVGHTDSDGSRVMNQRLSEVRAQSVVSYLRKLGISKNRMIAIGYGEDKPLLPNTSRRNKALNRRIEFVAKWDYTASIGPKPIASEYGWLVDRMSKIQY